VLAYAKWKRLKIRIDSITRSLQQKQAESKVRLQEAAARAEAAALRRKGSQDDPDLTIDVQETVEHFAGNSIAVRSQFVLRIQ
jgi:hypothetical protein